MIMFASDLDRTLIYSKRALEEMRTPLNDNMICVEKRNGEEVSYMTKKAFFLLEKLADSAQFVPVTTRTYEQYKRVFIFGQEIKVDYSVTSNGAKIHYKGNLLTDWEESVTTRLENECAVKEDLLIQLNTFLFKGTLKIADDLFFYYVLEEQISTEIKDTVEKLALSLGWKVSLQGRKLYFMPLPICKGEAIKFIQNREGIKSVTGAGDSLLDWPFLKICDFPFVPRHGELAGEQFQESKQYHTENQGAYAGEEILESIHQLYQKQA